MPLFETQQDGFSLDERDAYQQSKPQEVDWHDKWAAGLALENPISGAIRYGLPETHPVDPNYDPYQGDDLAGYPALEFTGSRSAEQTADIKQRIDRQRDDRRLLADNPGTEIASSVVGALGNPILAAGGFTAAPRSVIGLMTLEAGAETVSEFALHSQQPERTLTQSAINVGSAGLVAGAFGGIAKAVTRGEVKRAEEALAREAEVDLYTRPAGEDVKSMGAAEVPQTTLEQETMTSGLANKLANPGGLGDILSGPGGRTMTESQSPAMRRFIQEIDTVYRTQAHEEGIARPFTYQSLIGQADADDAAIDQLVDQQFKAYTKAGGDMSHEEFNAAISHAMRNGDRSEVEQVATVAGRLRRYLDAKFDAAVEQGLYPGAKERYTSAVAAAEEADDYIPRPHEVLKPKGAPSYLPRVYDRQALKTPRVRAAFRSLLKGKLLDAIMQGSAKSKPNRFVVKIPADRIVDEAGTAASKPSYAIIEADELMKYKKLYGDDLQIVTGGMRGFEGLQDEADKIAAHILDGIEGGPIDTLAIDHLVPKAGSLNERTLTFITDQELEQLGVLVSSARDLVKRHNREMTRELALGQLFGERDMRGIKATVRQDYDKLLRDAEAAGDANQLDALRKARDADMRTVDLVRDRITGVHQMPGDPTSLATNVLNGVRTYNTVTLLLGAAVSNFTDLVAPALRHGAVPVLKELAGFAVNVRRFKQAKNIANHFGLATEAVTGQRVSAMLEGGGPTTKLQQQAMNVFGKVTGMNLVTDIAETVAAMVGSRRIAQMATRYGKKDVARLAEIGIDQNTAKRIAEQHAEHSIKVRGVIDPRTAMWEDAEAARVFENALRRDARMAVVRPGIVDVPAWMDSGEYAGIGKVIGQFQRFNYSATQRLMVAGWQRADAEYFSGMLTLLAVGYAIDSLKTGIRGEDPSKRDPDQVIIGAIDRSGIMGVAGIALSAGHAMATGSKSSRYIQREPWSVATGPGPEHAARVTGSVLRLVTGNGKENDAWTALKGVPFLNALNFIDLTRLAVEGGAWRDKGK